MDVTGFEPNEYRFVRLTENLIPDLIAISISAFGIEPTKDYYIKKNDTKSFGEPYLGYIAYSAGGVPAAFYGVYACEVELEGKVYKAVQSGDTMTHKEHTGKGLFTSLAKATYALCKEQGVSFVFGFPNYNSYPGFVKKLNWICPGNMVEYRFKIPTLPLLKLAKKVSFFNFFYQYYFSLIAAFYKPKVNFFKSSVIETGVGGVRRSEVFVKYKNFGGARLVLLGNVHVWLKPDGFMYIGDIDRTSNLDVGEVINSLKKFCFLTGADVMIFQTTQETFLDKKMRSIMEPKEAFPYGYCNFGSDANLEKLGFVFADVDTF